MQLLITRETSTTVTTPGQLFLVNGNSKRWLAYTLEDVVRAGAKVHGRTAIPAGTYELRISLSNRFKKELPEVLSVPGFTGVRIHGGNTHENTEGCPLVGMTRNSSDRISNCSPAVEKVMRLLREAAVKGEKCTLRIINHGEQ